MNDVVLTSECRPCSTSGGRNGDVLCAVFIRVVAPESKKIQ